MTREEVREKITKILRENYGGNIGIKDNINITDAILDLPGLKEYFVIEASGVFAKRECTKCNYGTKECPESLPNCDHGYISRELTNVELLEAAKMLIKEINDPDPSLSAYEGPVTLPSGERLELAPK